MKDRKLPALEKAVNHAEMRRIFSGLSSKDENEKFGSIQTIDDKILKHKLGKTCVIEYCLHASTGKTNPFYAIGKMYRKNRGEAIFRHLQALWKNATMCPLSTIPNAEFGMAEPLWYVPELGMVLQKKIHAAPLKSILQAIEPVKAIKLVAKNLAILHSLRIDTAAATSLAENTHKFLQQKLQQIIAEIPAIDKQIHAIVTTLCDDCSLENVPKTPVHGDLNLSQIFLDSKQAYFIDFDGFCRSHPALDIANFMAILKVKCRQSGTGFADMFLQAYLHYRSLEYVSGLNLYLSLAYLRRAIISFRQRDGEHWRDAVKSLVNVSQSYL